MDFYERFRKLPGKKQQSFIQATSKIGDPEEIISYIAAMPILNERGKGVPIRTTKSGLTVGSW